jgi:hypothetical protein
MDENKDKKACCSDKDKAKNESCCTSADKAAVKTEAKTEGKGKKHCGCGCH